MMSDAPTNAEKNVMSYKACARSQQNMKDLFF